MTDKLSKYYGIALLCAWLSIIYFLYPLPHQIIHQYDELRSQIAKLKSENIKKVDNEQIKRALTFKHDRENKVVWISWIFKLLLIALGIISGVAALYNIKHWKYFVTVTSISYLFWWYQVNISSSESTVSDAFLTNIANLLMSKSIISPLVYLHKELILPILHFLGVSFLVYLYFVTRKQNDMQDL
jgi:hypothetical protein